MDLRCGRSGAPTGGWSRVIHRPEKSTGLRRRFDGESHGNPTFQLRLFACDQVPFACDCVLGARSACVTAGLSPARLSSDVHHRSSWRLALADIFVQCPRTGAPVPTGLKTEWVLLKSLPCVAVPLRCPACGQMHKWKPDDAWIGSARQSSDASLLSASRASLFAASSGNGAKTPE